MATRTYYKHPDGHLVRTQAALPKGEPIKKVAIPMDTEGMLAFLNGLINKLSSSPPSVSPPEESAETDESQPEACSPVPPAAPHSMTLTEVEEFIQNADAVRLASITQNACYRMMELTKQRS